MEKSIYTREYEILLSLLKSTRQELGITQEELATKLNETQSFVSKVERGERRLDAIELRKICLALGTSLSTFAKRLEKLLSQDK